MGRLDVEPSPEDLEVFLKWSLQHCKNSPARRALLRPGGVFQDFLLKISAHPHFLQTLTLKSATESEALLYRNYSTKVPGCFETFLGLLDQVTDLTLAGAAEFCTKRIVLLRLLGFQHSEEELKSQMSVVRLQRARLKTLQNDTSRVWTLSDSNLLHSTLGA